MLIVKTEEEWRRELTPEEYRVIREKGTEAPFTGEYYLTKDKGTYRCRACGAELFSSDTKFDSGTGWPSFTRPAAKGRVELRPNRSRGLQRTEAVCARCGAHLGHVFDDGPKSMPNGAPAEGKRYCVNSCSLDLEKQ